MGPGKSPGSESGRASPGAVLPELRSAPAVVRSRRLVLIGASVAVVFVVVFALSFGPVVRSVVEDRANALGIDVHVGAVRPGLGAVQLLGVRARPRWLSGVSVDLDHVVVDIGWAFGVRAVEIHGGTLRIDGTLRALRKQWQGRSGRSRGGEARGAMPVLVDGMTVTWANAFGRDEKQVAWGVRVARSGDGVEQFGADLVRAAGFGSGAEVRGLSTEFRRHDGQRVLSRVSATGVRAHVDLDGRFLGAILGRQADGTADKAGGAALAVSGAVDRAQRGRRARDALREVARIAGTALLPGAHVEVTGVHAELRRGGQLLNVGPGQLVVARDHERLDVRLTPGSASAASTVTLALALPFGEGPVDAELAGGPVSLAKLGVHEGDMGLADVNRTELEVRGRATLAQDGSTLGLSGRFLLDNLSLRHEKLAKDVVRGIRLGGSGSGLIALDGSRVKATDVELSVGMVKSRVSADIERGEGDARGVVSVAVPLASCQDLFDSTPRALLPDLAGMKLSGNFSFDGRVQFDTRRPADIDVTWKIQNACRITAVPANVHPSRFDAPWRRVVDDGTGAPMEIESGPGTPGWVPFYDISAHMETAVIVCEDSRFRQHGGFDEEAIADSIKDNLKAGRFVRGASTISMQLAKNLYLVRDKTLSRKLEEAVLTMLLEQELVKEEILELYFNVIEFGPGLFGIGPAAQHYFGVRPSELSVAQCLYLASILPNPKHGHFGDDGSLTEKWTEYVRRLARIAHKIRRISDEELATALVEEIRLGGSGHASDEQEDESFVEGRVFPGVRTDMEEGEPSPPDER